VITKKQAQSGELQRFENDLLRQWREEKRLDETTWRRYLKIAGGAGHPELLAAYAELRAQKRGRGKAKPSAATDAKHKRILNQYYDDLRTLRAKREKAPSDTLKDEAQKRYGISTAKLKRLIQADGRQPHAPAAQSKTDRQSSK
jgi:hypothetical protein